MNEVNYMFWLGKDGDQEESKTSEAKHNLDNSESMSHDWKSDRFFWLGKSGEGVG